MATESESASGGAAATAELSLLDKIVQADIEAGYRRFIGLVGAARHKTPQQVDAIGQGRVWIGGTAHQLGLVDRFGGLSDAVAEAARRAGLDPTKVHAVYLEKAPSAWSKLLAQLLQSGDSDDDVSESGQDVAGRIATARTQVFAQAVGDARRLASGPAVQVRCLACRCCSGFTSRCRGLLLLLLKRLVHRHQLGISQQRREVSARVELGIVAQLGRGQSAGYAHVAS